MEFLAKNKRWQVLDVGSIWMKEFAYALSKLEDIVCWSPRIEPLGLFRTWQRHITLTNPELETLEFPLQRGYAKWPISWLFPFEESLIQRLLAETASPEESPLICSTPFYAPVAERWPGPVIYYVTDLTFAYEGMNPEQVLALDVRMCRVARVVCPNSRRIAEYLVNEAGCSADKITIIPNATRESNVAASPRFVPGRLPEDVQDLPRPIAGVLGDLSGNMDWVLIAEAIEQTPSFSWLFVGPTTRTIVDLKQNAARVWVQKHGRFVGMKQYGELQAYARCVDVAVLPYRKKEPTYSGSSTRFYEHLSAGRPMIATRGFAELLEKVPLVTLVDTAEEMKSALLDLYSKDFSDGYETARWEASKEGTWEQRARAVRDAVYPASTDVDCSRSDTFAQKLG
jgi:glycosyltransferase involved in cell wall biosynthesis